MKSFKTWLTYLAMVCLLFTSCSKDEASLDDVPANKGVLTFGAVLNDLMNKNVAIKQAIDGLEDLPDCSDDSPAYVLIRLEDEKGNTAVGTEEDPVLRVNINPDPEDVDGDGIPEYFTEESTSLELPPGVYKLTHFTVHNTAEEAIWVAPVAGGVLADFVPNPLPLTIDLIAGVRKYVNVDVLCYDNRDVNQYGYAFFSIRDFEAYKFCIFAKFCPTTIQFPAAISVNVWIGKDDTGTLLHSGLTNDISLTPEGDPYATPICFQLPDTGSAEDIDYLYYEVTLQDWEGAYGDVEQTVISGNLSKRDILDNFEDDGSVNFELLRFGCDETEVEVIEDVSEESIEGDEEIPEDEGGGEDEETQDCSSAYVVGDTEFAELGFSGWGWAEEWRNSEEREKTYKLYTDAVGGIPENGTYIADITISRFGGTLDFSIDYKTEIHPVKFHIWLDTEKPHTSSPDAYTYEVEDLDGERLVVENYGDKKDFWMIIHGEFCDEG